MSKTETKFLDSIETLYGIHIERSFIVENGVFDGKYENILIECDGSYWHSSQKAMLNDEYKNKLALDNAYVILRFKIDSVKQISKVISENKQMLDKHFIHLHKGIHQELYPT